MITLGYINTDNFSIPIIAILMIAKYYIFKVSLNSQRRPSIFELQDLIKNTYMEQSLVPKINGRSNKFQKNWLSFPNIFDTI